MRTLSIVALAGAAGLTLTGAAIAAEHDAKAKPAAETAAPMLDFVPVRYVPVQYVPVRMVRVADPFADMERMMAAMQAQHAAMMRQAAMLAAQARQAGGANDVQVNQVSAGNLPAGASYSITYVSSSSGGGTCGQMVRVTQRQGAAPQRISQTFGDCGGQQGAAPAPAPAAPVQPPRPAIPTV